MKKGMLLLCLLCVFSFSISSFASSNSWNLNHIEVSDEASKLASEVEDNVTDTLQPFLQQPYSPQLKQRILKATEQALQALGYYHTNIRLLEDTNTQSVRLIIELGKALTWQSIHIEIKGEANTDPALHKLLSQLPIKAEDTVNHADYESAKSLLESSLLSRGYFDFKWLQHRLEISKKQRFARVRLSLDSGSRYYFGNTLVSANSKAKKYIQSLAPFNHSTPYDDQKLADYNLDLTKTPYFKAIKVYPLLRERASGQVPIQVEVVDKPANSYEIGGGFSTDLGAKGRFKWSKPWVSDDGHFFDSNVFIAQRQQSISGSYSIPVNNPIDDIWRVSGGYLVEDDLTQGVDSKIWNVQLQRQWLTSGNWIRTAFVRREHESTKQSGELKKTEMLVPGISYAKKQSVGGVTPTWGEQTLFSIEFASNSLISSTSLLKVQLEQAWLRRYYQKHWLITRFDLGAIVTDDISETPFNMRFFAGGDQSIRGFAYQAVAPKEDDKILGGKYLAVGSLEYNYQFLPNWRVATFVDFGTATNDFEDSIEVGAGLGIRYITPVGPIRLDHAWGLSKKSRSTRLSIVIGPEI